MIHDPPATLFVRGDLGVLSEKPCVALVGARKATKDGSAIAHKLAAELAKEGWVVVSGMAYGIDRAAHEGALDAGGQTIAVWGTGPDVIYPRAHRKLAERIFKSGAAITEFPLGTEPKPYNFPQRNRIISGISMGVVVVEAADSSGSLITADFALEQGRDVCAIPWNAGLVMGAGTNRLIRHGAALVENATDVIEVLSGLQQNRLAMKKSRQVKADAATESQLNIGINYGTRSSNS
jgi:DNA processing protein